MNFFVRSLTFECILNRNNYIYSYLVDSDFINRYCCSFCFFQPFLYNTYLNSKNIIKMLKAGCIVLKSDEIKRLERRSI